MSNIDEAFLPFQQIAERMLALSGEIADEDAGVRTYIYECSIETPVELDVVRDDDGALAIGTSPPLYRVNTSFQPVFHNLKITAEIVRETYAG